MTTPAHHTTDAAPSPIRFREALWVWLRVAALSFGGPAGQIAVMHRILVEEKKWLDDGRFLHALNYCMLLPGPEAQQLATYIGWLLHRAAGGLVAGTLFILPGFLSILGLSVLYAVYHDTPAGQAVFFGLKAAVLAVVIEAVMRIGKKSLRNRVMVCLAGVSFIAIFFFETPFPVIILTAGLTGLIGGRLRPDVFHVIKGHKIQDGPNNRLTHALAVHPAPTWGRTWRVLAVWLSLWFVPIGLLAATLGTKHVLTTEALFFSKAAVVTFGGAYSVLAYIAQQAVETHRWLLPGEMLDGLGMAETTPGPLIQVVQFVGFMGAYRQPEPFTPMAAAVLGSVITTWVTFVPCFLWIFLGAPYVERLRDNRVVSSGLSTITAVVVGVVLNLAVWFSLHVLFGQVVEQHYGPLRLLVPGVNTLDWASLLIACGAFIAMFKLKWGMIPTLVTGALIGVVYFVCWPS